MDCPGCHHENAPDARFCAACGIALALQCRACRAPLAPGSRFCNQCGAAIASADPGPGASRSEATLSPQAYTPKHLADKILRSRSALEGERKQVTVLFADVKGSMALAGQLDPEEWHRVLDRFFAILADGVHRYEGTINQYTGDGVMALFGAPIAHEDHAQRACYAALQLRDDLRRYALDLRMEHALDFGVRIGLNSGAVIVGRIGDDLRMDYTAQGQTVGLAQRLEQLCETGHVYLSEHTARLVKGYFGLRDLGRSKLAGTMEAVGVLELESATGAHSRIQVSRARGLTAFVGRHDELDILGKALERARSGHGQVMGVVGEPGLGKSRLCYEFAERCRDQGVPVYECHCPSYGTRIPFVPVLELFRSYFGIAERDAAELARQKIAGKLVLLDPSLQDSLPTLFEFLGVADALNPTPRVDAEVRQRQMFNMLHKIVRAQSARGQVSVTLVDDLHWIDRWSDEFVAQLVEAAEHSHALLLVNFRPEYHAAWATRAHCQQLPLVPLGADALHDMVASLLGPDPSVAALTQRIMRWTTGNPLYAEEVINTLIETGQLEGQRGAYRLTRDVAALDVPTSVQAIIAARIDRLSEAGKALLNAAAVIGKEFSQSLIERVVDMSSTELTATLERLKSGDFIYETALYPVIEYSFKHPLVHEVAYETQLRDRRERQHAVVATTIEELEPERLDENSSRLAYHWEQARELASALAWHERAAGVAGLNDPHSCLAHWERVVSCAAELEPTSAMLKARARACRALLDIKWRLGTTDAEARALYEAGIASAEQAGDTALRAALTGTFSILRGVSAGNVAEYLPLSREAVRLARLARNGELLHAMENLRVWGLFFGGKYEEGFAAGAALLQELPDGVGYGEEYVPPNVNWSLRMAMAYMSGAIGDLDGALAHVQSAVRFTDIHEWESYRHTLIGFLNALYGRFDRAREQVGMALEGAELSRAGVAVVFPACPMGLCHLAAGEHAEAADVARRALEIAATEHTAGVFVSGVEAVLAEAELAMGNFEKARDIAHRSVECSRHKKVLWNLMPWLALSRVYIALREVDAARRTLDETEMLVAQTGARVYRPFLHEVRARFARRFAGEWSADTELARARRLFSELGAEGQVARLDAAPAP